MIKKGTPVYCPKCLSQCFVTGLDLEMGEGLNVEILVPIRKNKRLSRLRCYKCGYDFSKEEHCPTHWMRWGHNPKEVAAYQIYRFAGKIRELLDSVENCAERY